MGDQRLALEVTEGGQGRATVGNVSRFVRPLVPFHGGRGLDVQKTSHSLHSLTKSKKIHPGAPPTKDEKPCAVERERS